MILVQVDNIGKSYGDKTLFDNISMTITDSDKIGLIGLNGTGKSTLLKIIAGTEVCDVGKIIYSKNLTMEYLPQNPVYNPDATILEQVFKGKAKLSDVSVEDESKAKTILTKLGIFDFEQKIKELSGGQKKRISLASALITPCDLLILDEPTNHMDNEIIDWLENYLMGRKGALLMITHDRYFLDRVVNKTIELDNKQLYSYDGNYSLFVEKKIERQTLENALERKRLNLFRTELEWIRRGARARSTKQKARIQRFESLKASLSNTEDTKMNISVASSRLGNKIIEMREVSKSFEDKVLIKDFNYIVLKDDRIGIVGNNGIGKSTLVNIIAGNLLPDKGFVDIGTTVKIGYFSQESENMPLNLRAIEYIKETAEYMTTADGAYISAAQLMETFLFNGDMQWTPISRLSGGERRRLYLLKVLMDEPNVLILDEPTNDLDIDTLKILENYIDEFQGAVITVSHDRYFLDRTCQKIFAFEGDGLITQYTGNYSDYLINKPETEGSSTNTSDKPKSEKSKSEKPIKETIKKPRFTYQEKLDFETIEGDIEELEIALDILDKKMHDNPTDFVLLQELINEKTDLEDKLLEKLERQEYLNNLYEEIMNFRKS